MTEWQSLPLALFIDVCDEATLGIEEDLCVILEIDLDDLVAQPEHNCVLRTHPLLHVDMRVHLQVFTITCT